MIALFTARNLDDDLYLKYFNSDLDDDIEQKLNGCLNGEFYEAIPEADSDKNLDIDIAWECAIKILGVDKIFDIVNNIDDYMDKYLAIQDALDGAKDALLKPFTDMKFRAKSNKCRKELRMKNYEYKNVIEADKPDIKFLTYLFERGVNDEKFYGMVMEHFEMKELALENGYKIHRDKIGTLVVDFEENGECDSIGLGLALEINKRATKSLRR